MKEEIKPEKVIEDVYVATVTKDNRVILQDRGYSIIAEIHVDEVAGFLLEGVCVCQRQENWLGRPYKPVKEGSESFWFCLDRNTNKRAVAEVWVDEEGGKQVIMRQTGSSCEL